MCETRLKHIANDWKAKTEASNTLFRKGDYEQSLNGYRDALDRAKVLNNYKKEATRLNIPFVQLFTISCNNIAFTYEEMQMKKKGSKMLKRVIYFLLTLVESNIVNLDEIQSELKRAMLNYADYAKRNGLQSKNIANIREDIEEHLKFIE
ncbi:tetratricopeptide repeat protein [Arenibacter sp. M-2]|uniref:tetratricopeptide repeat protein n=1 Tax=Flavobacteriaceae TaxID=49546 RepID=UPI00256FF312|nr:tetratricopeptide repeat protein [Arenibacter sp. M-2]MDL5512454.1 tetratricopeptide repeat protein [Arenibacter sp. M-2]